mmetsp:Transcript_29377/g.70656  ORF Transcript_29377/g.70656 Transcript_29377/m.70656 type:complete len:389 (+) Transcript_29377:229-1395(+)|eukprot:CAMPEP_0113626698 /NCGR_PEP_ID=MMETSP0017_2-20120614/13813_1 /TAXON_ID=2856 /ORGANISM="Cylindrotheca closterium" /LENGTH=388 /DNA_ID=CAMNT_0000536899 /DNA_START=229 /DNA_END=1395 /DNA_ORIENTATION=+ /assembly_acc=CAM_ASM_000147
MNLSTSSTNSQSLKQGGAAQQSLVEPQPITSCVSQGADVLDSQPTAAEDDAIIAAPEPTNEDRANEQESPAEIPVGNGENEQDNDVAEEQDDDDASEYSYEDDEDAAFSGFLSAPAAASHSTTYTAPASNAASPANIVEEETTVVPNVAIASDSNKKKWREPTREAVSMSLRAQQETSGSKRRLAQDLYRIMNQDTKEAGFSLAPQSEDTMDKWTIKLFQFDKDSNLAKDMLVLGQNHVELEMKFPDQYPFEPPFVRVVKPRFKKQTGFVMNGALCMELLTKDGWNPINDIESVIVSVRSLLVVGDGRLQAAVDLSKKRYQALLEAASGESSEAKRQKLATGDHSAKPVAKSNIGGYSNSEAQAAYSHLSDYHKKKGWDSSGWWARKG